jgi:hypothetical protein
MKLLSNFKIPIPINNDNCIISITVIRNEYLLLEYFLKYYKKKGITHFIFIDNDSTDDTVSYLLNSNYNIMLFSTKESFLESKFGSIWVIQILNKYCKNKWIVCVDSDELIYINNLQKFANKLDKENVNVCRFYLLDMYPKDSKVKYIRGTPFLKHSNYYDKESDINNNYNAGMRLRTMGMGAYLKKHSFFKYNFYDIANIGPGFHHFYYNNNVTKLATYNENIKITKKTEYILHFKFLKPNLKKIFNERVKRNQDWNNSKEYIAYSKAKNYNFYDSKYSLCFDKYKPKFKFINK